MRSQLRCFQINVGRIGCYRLYPVIPCLLLAIGCDAPCGQSPTPELTRSRIEVSDYDLFFDSTLSTLRFHDFAPIQADRFRGDVLTQRTVSGQWFEFGRIDNQTAIDVLESSLHTIGRQIFVTVRPAAAAQNANTAPISDTAEDSAFVPPDNESVEVASAAQTQTSTDAAELMLPDASTPRTYDLTVRVQKTRYAAPNRQLTTASGALAIYSEQLPTTEGLRRSQVMDAHWVDLGRDVELERVIMERILTAWEVRKTEDSAAKQASGTTTAPSTSPATQPQED